MHTKALHYELHSNLWKIHHAEFVGKHGACEEIGDLERQGRSIAVLAPDEVSDFVVDADAESTIDLEHLEKPSHADEHQVQVVNRGTLHDPIYSTRHELRKTSSACQKSHYSLLLLLQLEFF